MITLDILEIIIKPEGKFATCIAKDEFGRWVQCNIRRDQLEDKTFIENFIRPMIEHDYKKRLEKLKGQGVTVFTEMQD